MSNSQKPHSETECDQDSNASLLSIGSESTITGTSTTPLNRRPRKQKDYQAALGVLQSRYGMGGDIPSPKKEPSQKLPERNRLAGEGSANASPSSSFTLGESPSSSLKQSTSRSSEGSSNSGERKKKFSLLRLFQEKKKKELAIENTDGVSQAVDDEHRVEGGEE